MKYIEETFKEGIGGFVKEYRQEFLLIFISTVLTVISLALFVGSTAKKSVDTVEFQTGDEVSTESATLETQTIFVDLSGAVVNPDVYEVTKGSRLRDGLNAAGGLSDKADRDFFNKNYNLARKLQDGEKIYIPRVGEQTVKIGQAVGTGGVLGADTGSSGSNASTGININTATTSQLDTLPGIGTVTAGKIIANRPYQTVDELLSRKVVGKSVFEKIKDKVIVE